MNPRNQSGGKAPHSKLARRVGSNSTASDANLSTHSRRGDSQRQTVPNHFHLSALGKNPARKAKNIHN
jgi:hypothetical protein